MNPRTFQCIRLFAAALCICINNSDARTATWDGEGISSCRWLDPANWINDTPPQSGIDSVLLQPTNHSVEPQLFGTFIVGVGKHIRSNDEGFKGILRIGDGGHLIIAQGATLDLTSAGAYSLAEGHGSMRLTIEGGASVKLQNFFNGNGLLQDHTTEFIANQSGITTVAVNNTPVIIGGRLEIDLKQYNLSNGRELVLFTYSEYSGQSTGFEEILLSEGWSGTIDYHYTTGNGLKAIAMTDLENKGAYVDIPEPKSYGLILSGLTAVAALIRRRR